MLTEGRKRVIIENVRPQVEEGALPAQQAVGESLTVGADVFADGHDVVKAVLLHRPATMEQWSETPMQPMGNDRWTASLKIQHMVDIRFTVEGYVDHFATWLHGLLKKVEAGQDVSVELLEGAKLVDAAALRARGAGVPAEADNLSDMAERLRSDEQSAAALLAEDPLLTALMNKHADRSRATRFDRELTVHVQPPLAGASAWYELFPRSCGPEGRHGTFADVEAELPRIADAGFDVVYLPPIHPIGRTFRKGKNNTVNASPDDVGSPWAIGASEGGHKSVHPELGTMEDFVRMVQTARDKGLEIALDIAFQCSPDHPYVEEHPEWFKKRADGSIQYAENPPKKYQDIYPFNFECDQWRELWEELKSIFIFWAEKGVRVFRVDNPHTKPLPFWRWCLAEVQKEYPDAIFLSEAFTRPKIMYRLAKAGFTQSYTYFTWRNSKWELTRYMNELVNNAPRDFFRPNFWPNTPDILPEYLQYGGRPAHIIRLVLAATLSSNYGIYGPAYELSENEALPGSEEYANSEKYEIRKRDLNARGTLHPFIKRLNAVRKQNPALLQTWNLEFLETENDFVIYYAKWDDEATEVILTAVNLDPHNTQQAWLHLPVEKFGIGPHQTYMVHDLLGDDKFIWQGPRNSMDFDPKVLPARIFKLKKQLRRETDFDYFM